ncbi:MAG: hypothetical protein PF961_13610 [Planctomycetota bacterium]|jgi:hypothetical protein|nr:hypothetical protein [Planctomycetota bacterium]
MLRLLVVMIMTCLVLPASQRDAMVEIGTMTPFEQELLAEVRKVEDRLFRSRGLQVEQRFEELGRMERTLERLADKTRGTRFENQAVYWLADWVMTYQGDLDRVQGLLEQLATLPSPAFKGAGRALMVRVLLGQGRIPQAEELAGKLVDEIPEFNPILRLVQFSQRVGQPAPRVPGRNLTGGGDDPIATRSEPWLLYAFTDLGDPEHRFGLAKVFKELEREEYRGRIALVVIAFDGDPLAVMEQSAKIAIPELAMEVLWANPNEGGDAAAWRMGWQLPELPVIALLGPDRTIMAINPTAVRLRPLAGLDPEDGSATSHGSLWRGRGGGKGGRR